jgi:hypothetical protein
LHGTRDPAPLAPDMGNGRLWVVRRPLRDGRYATQLLGRHGQRDGPGGVTRLGVVPADRISEDYSVRGDLELADLGVVGACA